MRRELITRIALFLCLLQPAPAQMPVLAGVTSVYTISAGGITLTATGWGSNGCCTTNSVVTGAGGGVSFACSSGSAVMAFVSVYPGGFDAVTMSDSASNSGYTAYGAQYAQSSNWNGGVIQWFYNASLGSSITSLTASFATNASFGSVIAHCITGLNASPADFAQVVNQNISTSITGGAFTTGHVAEIVFFGLGSSGAILTPGSGYTATTSASLFGADEYQIFSTIQTGATATGTWGSSTNWNAITAGLH